MRKIAVLAVGFNLGQNEITETVSLFIALSEFKAQFQIFALDTSTTISDHPLKTLEELNPDQFDALVLPGGIGNATQISTWQKDKEKMTVNPLVEKIIKKFHADSKPIGAICMAPIVIAKVLSKFKPNITLGEGFSETHLIEKWNVSVEKCPATDYITDRDTKVITTPAYMDDVTPFQVYTGIRAFTKELVEMA
jgi:enhancing lycopene biosynthesis protein 2